MGHIYRIDFPEGYFYIGSTKGTLKDRLIAHKKDRKANNVYFKSKGLTPLTAFDIYIDKYGWNTPTIVSLEEFSGSKEELVAKEFEYIRPVINDPKNLNEICKGVVKVFSKEKQMCLINRHLDYQIYREYCEFREKYIDKLINKFMSLILP
jgi:hypothetical protein